MKSFLVSIIVCTYNRSNTLPECLETLTNQTCTDDIYQIIIVNNNSPDDSQSIIDKYVEENINFIGIHEATLGLSHARNKGYLEAKSEWVGYVDDDAKVPADFIQQVVETIQNFDFDCFGGCYESWFKFGKPKWFPVNFEKNCSNSTLTGNLSNKDEIWGSAMFFKKCILERFGGFPLHLGMTGNRIAYGEESSLLEKLNKEGYSIGINPEIKVKHLVGKHKLKLLWHIKSAYAHGRDQMIVDTNLVLISALRNLITGFSLHLFRGLILILRKPNYYWQNWLLDTGKHLAYYIGAISWLTKKSLK